MFRMTRPNLWITLALTVGTALMGTACSGSSTLETTAVAESNSVAEVAESVISVESTASETTVLGTTSLPTTIAAPDERMTVAEAQAIVDQLNQKVGDAYRLAKQGDLVAARAKLAEAETGDQLATSLSGFGDGVDLSQLKAVPGNPAYKVLRVSDKAGSCTTLAGVSELRALFEDGLSREYETAVRLREVDLGWRVEFSGQAEASLDLQCP